MLTLAAILLPPLTATLVAAALVPYRRAAGWSGVVASAISLLAALRLALDVVSHGPLQVATPLVGEWRVDALSALLAVCVTFVVLLATLLAPGLDGSAPHDADETRRLRVYLHAFAFTMLAAVTVPNVALMWVAIEATTIASALAIPLHRTQGAVEASWKYILVCSVGIALAFTGTILAYFDIVATGGDTAGALNWHTLRTLAPTLHPELLQIAFAFLVVGYGTKAGLAPMHTWLPDAHSEAPSPISAMMSGVLLAVAMYAVARWKSVVDAAGATVFSNALLIGFGLLSVTIGVFSLVIQRHYKRMLAYSSVEHLGLVAIGLALGPLGSFAAWLHVANHAVAKSASFLLAGRILSRYGSTRIDDVTGLLRTMPWTGTLFAGGVLALVGLPPFGLFVSEFLLLRAAIAGGRTWLAGAVLALLLIAFVSLLSHLNRMLYGEPPTGVPLGEARGWPIAALVVPAVLLVALGIVLPGPFVALLDQSVGALAR